jgi:uncharacterized membrane protein
MSDLLRVRRAGLLAGATLVAGALAGTLLVGGSASAAPAASAAAVTTTLSAVVDGNGTAGTNLLSRGNGAVSAAYATVDGSNSSYEVIFNRDVTNCVYTATLGGLTTESQLPAFISVTRRSGKPNGVFVRIVDGDLANAFRKFHLVVAC